MENLEGEIWKPIIYEGVDYTGHYETSNMGRFRSFKYNSFKILKGCISDKGYQIITLTLNRHTKLIRAHRIVAEVFGISEKGKVIDHKNSDKKDNRLSNLQCLSNRANCSKERTILSMLPCGVQIEKDGFCVKIRIEKGNYYLGHYPFVDIASNAYKLALQLHEKGIELPKILQLIDEYREKIGLKKVRRFTRKTMNLH